MMRRADGAAASAPKPPFSTVTATTIGCLGVVDVGDVPGLVVAGRLKRGRCRSCRRSGSGSGPSPVEDVGRRAAGLVGGLDAGRRRIDVAIGRVDRRRARAARARCAGRVAVGGLDLGAEVRARRPCRRFERRVHDRHLQRRGLHVALADREVRPRRRGSSARSTPSAMRARSRRVLLLAAGASSALIWSRHARVGDRAAADSRRAGRCRSRRSRPELRAHFCSGCAGRVRVQALAERCRSRRPRRRAARRQVDRAVGLLAGVARLRPGGADLDAAVVVDDAVGVMTPVSRRGERGDRLEGRARRIAAARSRG